MAEWYYCVEHGAVEEGLGCRAAVRLGPYSSESEAMRALERVDERNEDWETDPRWNEEE